MKKVGYVLVGMIVVLSTILVPVQSVSAQTKSASSIVTWMHDNGLTKFDNQAEFGWDRSVTRGEISKFFTKFAELINKEKVKTADQCQFLDIDGYDYTLVPTIIEACEYGLVKGHNGNYYPNKNLTKAEALTVIIRAVIGSYEENVDPRWKNYHAAGEWLGILQNGESVWDLDTIVSRGTVGTWLNTASLVDFAEIERVGSQKLLQILIDAFGEGKWVDSYE